MSKVASAACVGLVGGLGPESTVDYYRRILSAWATVEPGSAPSLVIDSLDVQRALRLVESDRDELVEYLLASIQRLARAGVDFAVLTANTPHLVFDELAERSPIPLLSIVETCAQAASRLGLSRLGLLGTRFTMDAPFYPAVFARHAIDVVLPPEAARLWVHDKYISELLRGDLRDSTRSEFVALIGRMRAAEALDGIILGGTELPLLLGVDSIEGLEVLDTTALHVSAIVKRLRDTSPSAGGGA